MTGASNTRKQPASPAAMADPQNAGSASRPLAPSQANGESSGSRTGTALGSGASRTGLADGPLIDSSQGLTGAQGSGGGADRSSAGAAPRPSADEAGDTRDRETRIRESAYRRYQERGGAPGGELDDWLAAEAEHSGRPSAESAGGRASASDRGPADRSASDRSGSERGGADKGMSDRNTSDQRGSDKRG